MLLSPQDDFERNTLAAVPGTLGKLAYLAALRQSDGQYHHWGMARQHGEDATNASISRLHSLWFLRVLRTPIASLWEELNESAPTRELGCPRYLAQLLKDAELMVPADLAGGSLRHFSSILAALSALAGPRAGSVGPDAWQSPPPAL